jgi:hypothetical protein
MGNKSGKAKKKDQKEEEDTSKVNGEAGQTENKTEDKPEAHENICF